MKKLLIVDLEATCHDLQLTPEDFFSEIIEIGAALLNTENFTIEAEYDSFVKPATCPDLSKFCRELTHIRQEDIDNGLPLAEAVHGLAALYKHKETVLSSWGEYDSIMLDVECQRNGIKYPFFGCGYIDLQHHHSVFYRTKKLLMADALQYHGIHLDGTHHRGIDDARNIAKIATKMIQDGWKHRLLK